MKKLLVLCIALAPLGSLHAQTNGFITTEHGVKYKILKHGNGRKPNIGDMVEMHIRFTAGDSVIFDSRKMNENKPVPLAIQQPAFNGDPAEAFVNISQGDSAIVIVSADSLKKNAHANMPWVKDGSTLEYDVVMTSVKTQEEMKAEEAAANAKQNTVDDKLLQDYFKKNKIKATKTASGLYYSISKAGNGDMPKDGQTVFVNYTGMTMDGKKFDSNVDSAFHHVQPFSFPLGQHHVIAGWDEGIALLKKGAKATLYIPSSLAYGHRGAGGAIPPDAVLIFDVELADIQ